MSAADYADALSNVNRLAHEIKNMRFSIREIKKTDIIFALYLSMQLKYCNAMCICGYIHVYLRHQVLQRAGQ